MGWVKGTYLYFVKAMSFLGHFFLLGLRLYWGYLLVIAGAGKWIHIHQVAELFGGLGIPEPQVIAFVVATVELLGGISLIFGLFSRFFALLVSVVMVTALSTAHRSHIMGPATLVQQEPFFYLLTSLAVLCFGPGLFSADYWLEKRSFGEAL